MHDVTFHSAALGRDMTYRVILPAHVPTGRKLPALYLLHGAFGDFRDWSRYSNVAQYAEHGLVLIMPDGGFSHYVNSPVRPSDRYEDYIIKDLIADAEGRFPIVRDRASRAIAGISMGGYGAITQGLKHPQLFVFAGGISSALDVPSRRFTIRRLRWWLRHRSIFGPLGNQTRRENDPFLLALAADPSTAPYIYLGCGEQEIFLAPNRKMAGILDKRQFHFEFRPIPGAHDWAQWNEQVTPMFQSLLAHVR
jgi:putative tributyrin esterase